METKYQKLIQRYTDLEKELADPKILGNPAQLKKLNQEYQTLKEITSRIKELVDIENKTHQAVQLLKEEKNKELRHLAEEELNNLKEKTKQLKQLIEELLKPKNPLAEKDIIMEIRAGTGGDEAALFAADLFRMYQRFAERHKLATALISSNRIGIGGFKEIIFEVQKTSKSPDYPYELLQYESGVHRVQRIPETEKQGRIHTSTATVAVLPVAEEVEIAIKPEELKIDVFRSSGPGGQSVNTTDSAVRITHLPTGLIVTCQDEKSQLQNREKALKILRSKLLQLAEAKRQQEEREARRSQIGSGDRAEKIRTYNFPQDRVTDHRLKKSWHNIEKIMAGELEEIIEALKEAD